MSKTSAKNAILVINGYVLSTVATAYDAKLVVDAVDVTAFDGLGNLTAMIPATVLQVLSAVGVGQALTMILAALAIRFALQLIPFVRLGS